MLVYHNLYLDEVCLHIFHFWISLLVDLHSDTNVFMHLMIFHRFPTHSAKDVMLCSFSSKFSPIKRMAEGFVKFPLSAIDLMSPCAGTFQSRNTTLVEQSLDFWRQCELWSSLVYVSSTVYDNCIQKEASMGLSRDQLCQSLLNHPGSFLAMFFFFVLFCF